MENSNRFRTANVLALAVSSLGLFAHPVPARAEAPPAFVLAWGTGGTSDGQFSTPKGIAVDAAGNVYVADSGNHRIQKFAPNGTFLTKWGSQGAGDGQLNNPQDIAVGQSGDIFVLE